MAANLNLKNLICFIDHNGSQSFGITKQTHPKFYPLVDKIKSFGWECKSVDGHNIKSIISAYKYRKSKKPLMIVCNTIKGKGVSFMENKPIWHYRSPNKKEYEIAVKEVLNKCKLYKNVIYFLDEPLHSTPPVDGSAMLKSYLLYLANKYNINMLLTTHYFSISELELSYPDKFRNISMESSLVKGKFMFPYKIKKGNSTQSISIELLKEKEFPEELISTAIKIKNKIYLDRINVY